MQQTRQKTLQQHPEDQKKPNQQRPKKQRRYQKKQNASGRT
jgi:hypothetical protein